METSLPLRLRREVLDPIGRDLIGKRDIIEVLGVALVAGENLFLLGPPGTGKSALVQELAARLDGQSFDYLLTRFTEPNELFGPFDLRRLREGDLVTNTEGMLPEADFVFLDELLNANSAILNSLLLALNERVFRRGRQTSPLPMLMAVGASNHLPEDDALAALYDRFLMRVQCDNVGDDQLGDVLDAGWQRDRRTVQPSMTCDEIRQLQALVAEVDLSPIRKPLVELVAALRGAGLPISDRRAVRLQRVIAASAVIAGRDVAQISDLWVARCIWETPPQREILAAHIDTVRRRYEPDPAADADDRPHPMADDQTGPDAETLARSIEAIARDPEPSSAEETLGLLAARVQWVADDDQRRSLADRIGQIRQTLPGAP